MQPLSLIKKPFLFVRHGQTDWNQRQLCQGQTDIELNAVGRQEALNAAKMLFSFTFGAIFASDLKRALVTAQIIEQHLKEGGRNDRLIELQELRERSWGLLEGESSEKMYAFEAREKRAFPSQGLAPEDLALQVEDLACFKARIAKGINFGLQQVELPLIVSHGRLFRSLCELMGLEPIEQIANSSVLYCEPKGEKWKITLLPAAKP